MTNEEIIELAHLSLSVEQSSQDSASQEQLENRKPPQGTDLLLLTFARKILEGKPYAIQSDNPETVRRVRAIAAQLGVSPSRFEQSANDTVMLFEAPSRN